MSRERVKTLSLAASTEGHAALLTAGPKIDHGVPRLVVTRIRDTSKPAVVDLVEPQPSSVTAQIHRLISRRRVE